LIWYIKICLNWNGFRKNLVVWNKSNNIRHLLELLLNGVLPNCWKIWNLWRIRWRIARKIKKKIIVKVRRRKVKNESKIWCFSSFTDNLINFLVSLKDKINFYEKLMKSFVYHFFAIKLSKILVFSSFSPFLRFIFLAFGFLCFLLLHFYPSFLHSESNYSCDLDLFVLSSVHLLY
jgi:hypothetical protein